MTSRERFELGLFEARAALAGAFGPMTKEERREFLAQIAREMAKAEARRQPHPQQKLDV